MVEAAPEKTDYCWLVSVSASALAGVAVGASASLDSPWFSEVSGSADWQGRWAW